MKGTIKKLNDKGFGFITPENSQQDSNVKDIFFHSSDLQGVQFNELQEGDQVTFETVSSEKGPRATKVVVG